VLLIPHNNPNKIKDEELLLLPFGSCGNWVPKEVKVLATVTKLMRDSSVCF
jgi:hypothetical protein